MNFITHLIKDKPTLLGFFLLSFVLVGCGPDEPENPGDNFNRKAMLTWYADDIIMPAYQDAQTKLESLASLYNDFKQGPSEAKLIAMQEEWKASYTSFIGCSSFNFGPADQVLGSLGEQLATFPVDTTAVNTSIANSDYSMDNLKRDTRGYLTLEFFLFDEIGNNAKALQRMTANGNQLYFEAVLNHAKDMLIGVNQGWVSYRAQFISNDGTDPGSSISLMYNELIKNYELLRNYKIGLPAGKRVGQTGAEPEMVEAYYSGLSLPFQKAHLDAFYRWYHGVNQAGVDGIGWVEYLESVVGGPELISDTEAQYDLIYTEYDKLPNQTFSSILRSNPSAVDAYYEEVSKCTRFFKSDMSSVLGIAITYDSGDGD